MNEETEALLREVSFSVAAVFWLKGKSGIMHDSKNRDCTIFTSNWVIIPLCAFI